MVRIDALVKRAGRTLRIFEKETHVIVLAAAPAFGTLVASIGRINRLLVRSIKRARQKAFVSRTRIKAGQASKAIDDVGAVVVFR